MDQGLNRNMTRHSAKYNETIGRKNSTKRNWNPNRTLSIPNVLTNENACFCLHFRLKFPAICFVKILELDYARFQFQFILSKFFNLIRSMLWQADVNSTAQKGRIFVHSYCKTVNGQNNGRKYIDSLLFVDFCSVM